MPNVFAVHCILCTIMILMFENNSHNNIITCTCNNNALTIMYNSPCAWLNRKTSIRKTQVQSLAIGLRFFSLFMYSECNTIVGAGI